MLQRFFYIHKTSIPSQKPILAIKQPHNLSFFTFFSRFIDHYLHIYYKCKKCGGYQNMIKKTCFHINLLCLACFILPYCVTGDELLDVKSREDNELQKICTEVLNSTQNPRFFYSSPIGHAKGFRRSLHSL